MSIFNDFEGFDSDVFESDIDSELGGEHLENEEWGGLENPEFDFPMESTLSVEDTDPLDVSSEDLDELEERADGLERTEERGEISFGRKNCATRHGCTGATNCNYDYASYPG